MSDKVSIFKNTATGVTDFMGKFLRNKTNIKVFKKTNTKNKRNDKQKGIVIQNK